MAKKLADLQTNRLHLRGLRPGDEAFIAMLDSDALVMRHIHAGVLPCCQAAEWARIQVEWARSQAQAYPSEMVRRFGKWMTEIREVPTRVGWVETSKFSDHERDFICVGYEFAPAFWGCGYAPEAVGRVIGHLFENLPEDCLAAYARPANERSLRVLEKLGFRTTGRQVLDGGKQLCTLYQLYASDWKRAHWPGQVS